MDVLDIAQPRCPNCGTVMRGHPRGFVCACGHVEDHGAELDAVVIPPDFDGPTLHGG
jgi:ribosomal protein S27AE